MARVAIRKLLVSVALAVPALVPVPAAPPAFPRGAVATVHRLASDAAVQAFRDGGNAVDAAVVAGLALGVVDGFNSGIGGGCLMLVRAPDGTLTAIDGRETAPAAATRDMYLVEGHADASLSRTGPLAVATPGQVAAFHDAITAFGRLPWAYHCRAAARIADEGFVISASYAARLVTVREDLARFPASREIFLRPDGSPRQAGDTLVQPDLGRSLRALADGGPEWFYRGA